MSIRGKDMDERPVGDDRGLRRLAMPVWGVLLVSVLTFAGLVYLITQGQDRVAVTSTRQVAAGVMENLKSGLEKLSFETAYWNEAVEHLVLQPDAAWAQENITSYLFETYGVQRSFVIGPDGDTIFLSMEDSLTSASDAGSPSPALHALIARSLGTPEGSEPMPVSGFYREDGRLWLSAVVEFTRYDLGEDPGPDQPTGAALVL